MRGRLDMLGQPVSRLAGSGEPLRMSQHGDVMRLELLSRKLILALSEACVVEGPIAGDQGGGRGW